MAWVRLQDCIRNAELPWLTEETEVIGELHEDLKGLKKKYIKQVKPFCGRPIKLKELITAAKGLINIPEWSMDVNGFYTWIFNREYRTEKVLSLKIPNLSAEQQAEIQNRIDKHLV